MDLTDADGDGQHAALASAAAAAVCASAVLTTCTATPVATGTAAAQHAFIGTDGSVLVDRDGGGAPARAGQLDVLGALEDGMVVDRAGAAVAAVSDMQAVHVSDVPVETLRNIAARGACAVLCFADSACCTERPVPLAQKPVLGNAQWWRFQGG